MASSEVVHALASEVVARLAPGLLVRSADIQFSSSTPSDEVMQRIALTAGLDVAVKRAAGALNITSTYKIEALGEDGETPSDSGAWEGWRCSVGIHGQWRLQEGDGPAVSDDAVRAFAATVAVMTLHPYARAQIQAAVIASGWPGYTLDVLTPQHEIFAGEEDPDEMDLSLIAVG